MDIIINKKFEKIQNIKKGDFVKSFNIETEKDEYQEVLNTMTPIIENDRQYDLYFEDNGIISTSDTHPMLVNRNNKWLYVKTKEVILHDIVKNTKGISKVSEIKTCVGHDIQYYDIEVNNNNNYYATSNNNVENLQVVHNSANCNFPFFTWEIESIVHLKSTKSTEENQVRGMDYTIHIDDFFLEKVKNNEEITLFSMEEVTDLYEAFYKDSNEFRELYEKYENKRGIRKKKINARSLLIDILNERFETGRIYLFFANNVREQNKFVDPVYMTNLCVEILLKTIPIDHIDDEKGRIATCILSCVNLGKITSDEELELACDIIVRFLDELIDYQEYPIKAAELSTKSERNLGIGISDYFHFLAKNKVRYNTKEGLELTHQTLEKFQYFLIKASVNLAKEKGPCEAYLSSKYSQGILPIDIYNKNVDKICKIDYVCDWEWLRNELLKYGIRNCVLSAVPPTASSSLVSNSTPGIDAPRRLLTTKISKKGTIKQLVPEYTKYSQYYTTAWELDNIEYLKTIAIIQKFIDQSISTNEYFIPSKYEGGNVPITELLKNIFFASKYGIKTLYYCNTDDGSGDEESSTSGCESGACSV